MGINLTYMRRRLGIMSQPHKETKTGDIVTFDKLIASPLSVLAPFSPVQAGTGDPYPGGGGKNKLDDSDLLHGFYNTTGTYTPNGNYISYKVNLPAGKYTFSTDLENCFIPRYLIDDVQTSTGVTTQYIKFTLDTDAEFKITIRNTSTSDISSITPHSQIESGSTATAYAPYSNIRPITGWSGCEVTETGKNLFDQSYANYKTGYYLFTNDTEQSNAKYKYTQSYFRVKPSTTYVMSYDKEMTDGIGCYVNLYDENKQYLSRISISGMTGTGRVSGSFTTTADTVFARFSMPYRSSDGGETDIQLEEGSTASTYEAFGTTLSVTWTIAGTVYGGSLKINPDGTGVVTEGMVHYEFDGSEDEAWIAVGLGTSSQRFNIVMSDGLLQTGAICNYLKLVLSNSEPFGGFRIIESSNTIMVTDSENKFASKNAFKNYLSSNPLHIVTTLATLITYNLSASEVGQLLARNGVNNVWANTNEEIAVTGWGH